MSKEKEEAMLPPVTFSTFVLSLNMTALIHLGEIPNPETNERQVNLALARHTIDTLDMLKEKTKGNLTHDEEQLLESVLYELRMRYIKRLS